jgi:hypothetical protein
MTIFSILLAAALLVAPVCAALAWVARAPEAAPVPVPVSASADGDAPEGEVAA